MHANSFAVSPVTAPLDIVVDIPGSKSITNRALLIACQCDGPVVLRGVLFSDDSRHFLDCLQHLGYTVECDEATHCVRVMGTGKDIPRRDASLYVGSAGTAARFITALLAAAPGTFTVNASAQMMKRPMQPLLDSLTELGSTFTFLQQPYSLPFIIHGANWQGGTVHMHAEKSSQFLSALLISGWRCARDLEIVLAGPLAAKPYIDMTINIMADFGVQVIQEDYQRFRVPAGQRYQAPQSDYAIEPDVSNACYFWAMATLTGGSVLVRGTHLHSKQGDIRFLRILEQLGSRIEDHADGVLVQGPVGGRFPGIEVDLGDMPDQTATLAAMAPFASSPTTIRNVGIIKYHETDRLQALVTELRRLGIQAEEIADGLRIFPGIPHPAELETYDDHRMAMAMALIGLRAEGIRIKNPGCTAKTFENYFEVFERLTTQSTEVSKQ